MKARYVLINAVPCYLAFASLLVGCDKLGVQFATHQYAFTGVDRVVDLPAGGFNVSWSPMLKDGVADTDGVLYTLSYISSEEASDSPSSVVMVERTALPDTTLKLNSTIVEAIRDRYSADVTNLMANGTHYMQVSAQSSDGQTIVGNKIAVVSNTGVSGLSFAGIKDLSLASDGKINVSWSPILKGDEKVDGSSAFDLILYEQSNAVESAASNNEGEGEPLVVAKAAGDGIDHTKEASARILASITDGYQASLDVHLDVGKNYALQIVGATGTRRVVGTSVGTLLRNIDPIAPTFDGLESAHALSSTRGLLTWSAAAGSGVIYNIYQMPNLTAPIDSTDSLQYIVSSLSPDKTYSFIVRAVGKNGLEDANKIKKSFRTLAYPVPDFNGVASVTSPSDGISALSQAILSWDPASGTNVTGYHIYVSETSRGQNFASPSMVDGAVLGDAAASPYVAGQYSKSATVSGLSPAKTYYFVVRAFIKDGSEILQDTNTFEKALTTASIDPNLAAPVVTVISPEFGPLAGSTLMTITGGGFLPGSTVTIGNQPCTGVSLTGSTTITCQSPAAGSAGAADVVVLAPTSKVATVIGGFYYTDAPAPTISAVSPPVGPLTGNTNLTITGSGFASGASVRLGGVACGAVIVDSATQMHCTTAANGAGSVNVSVRNADRQTGVLDNGYEFKAPPVISSITPAIGSINGGTSVVVRGSGFLSGISVVIGGQNCIPVTLLSATELRCTTYPRAAATVDVVATNTDGQSNTSTGAYIYTATPAPAITSLSPGAGPLAGGTLITINGSNFSASGVTARVGGLNCSSLTRVSASRVTCLTAAHAAGQTDVEVVNQDGQLASLASSYSYTSVPAPVVTAVSPTIGSTAGGTTLTIGGLGFASGATISLGAATCATVTFVSSTQLSCVTSARSAETLAVSVTNPDTQIGSLSNAFTYTSSPPPTITSVSPSYGAPAGGSTININGTNFTTGATASIGTTPCTSSTVTSATRVVCVTPAGTSGVYDVTVANADTQAATRPNAFTYLGPVTVSSVLPSGGSLHGGSTIVIAGSGFVVGAVVTVGGQNCASTVDSSTQITCTTSAHALGVTDIVVTNVDSQTGTLSNSFTFRNEPYIESIVPSQNLSTSGGTIITVYGHDFMSGASISLGGTDCLATTFVTDKKMTCTVPPHASGSVDITLTNSDQQAFTKTKAATYGALTWTNVNLLAGKLSAYGYQDGTGANVRIRATSSIVHDNTYLYFVEEESRVLRRTDPTTGNTTTIAGSTANLRACGNGTGTNAQFSQPVALAIDATLSNLYISDKGCSSIRKFNIATGVVTTVGSLSPIPYDIDVDASYAYIASGYPYYLVLKMALADGSVTTVAGGSTISGDVDGTGTAARFGDIRGIARVGTTLYVSDMTYCKIRAIDIATEVVTTVAGSTCGSQAGNGLSAKLPDVVGLSKGDTTLYMSTYYGASIRSFDTVTGDVTTTAPAGTCEASPQDGAIGTNCQGLGLFVSGITSWGSALYYGDMFPQGIQYSSVGGIRRLDMSSSPHIVNTVTGDLTVRGFIDGNATTARFSPYRNYPPRGNAIIRFGDHLYVADTGNFAVRRIDPATGVVDTYFGSPTSDVSTNGALAQARSRNPQSLATDGINIFLGESCSIRKIDPYNSTVSTLIGVDQSCSVVNGTGATVRVGSTINGMAIDTPYLYFIDASSCRIRRVNTVTAETVTIAGTGTCSAWPFVDATGTSASFFDPRGLVLDAEKENLYVADRWAIRKINLATLAVTTLTGNTSTCALVDGDASTARMCVASNISSDGTYLYMVDSAGPAIRRVSLATGAITTMSTSNLTSTTAKRDADSDGLIEDAAMTDVTLVHFDESQLFMFGGWGMRKAH